MKKYIVVNYNNDNNRPMYVKAPSGGECTYDKDLAYQWDNLTKVTNFLSNNGYIGKGFKIEPIQTITSVSAKNIDGIKNFNIENKTGNLKDIFDIINSFNDIANEKDSLISKLSEIDKYITDIQHCIEFGNFNASDGFKIYKILQNYLQKRRNIKDRLNFVMKMSDITNTESMKSIINFQDMVSCPSYIPRNVNELFEEVQI